MKRTKLTILKLWQQIGLARRLSKKLTSIAHDDKKRVIIDQLFFGLNTDESIALFEKVRIDFRTRMENRKAEAILVETSISNYYPEA